MEDQPVQAAEEGTATSAEETAAESTETAEPEAPADDSIEDAESGDNGEQAASGKPEVPYTRFKSVNERRKAAEAEVQRLKGQLEALTPKAEVPVAKTAKDRIKNVLKTAPADMNPLQQFELYTVDAIEAHLPEYLDRWFESKMGMKPDAVAATMQHQTASTQAQIVSEFNEAAKAHSLDPKNEIVRAAVGALMDTGKFRNFGEAMDAFKPATTATTTPTQPRKPNGKGPETDTLGVDGLSRVRRDILSKEEALALAAKGVRVEQRSVTEILKSASK